MDGSNPDRAKAWLDLFVHAPAPGALLNDLADPTGKRHRTPTQAELELRASQRGKHEQTSRDVAPSTAEPGVRLWRSD